MTRILSFFIFSLSFLFLNACGPSNTHQHDEQEKTVQEIPMLKTGAEVLLTKHLENLQTKKIALVGNHTSNVGGVHLVDTLLEEGVEIVSVFAPEHGFRGTADAGEKVSNSKDPKTGLPILSLYGKNRKPSEEQLKGVDLMIFDIQDVGTRFYTYISTMSYVMEACAEQGIEFWIIDRPNPNGWYVDGPVMEPGNTSFIGMHEIPIVHGMTIGEYAQMVKGEGWIKDSDKLKLTVIPCENYVHSMTWDETGQDWIAPSPNLASEYAAYLYAAICWFEPTPVSVGRGTDSAFTILGAPWYTGMPESRMNLHGLEMRDIGFTPRSLEGKSKYPKFQDEPCVGLGFINRVGGKQLLMAGIDLLKIFYNQCPAEEQGKFFKKGFNKWPGNTLFEDQVKNDIPSEEIHESWQGKVENFKVIRRKYLLYPDFE